MGFRNKQMTGFRELAKNECMKVSGGEITVNGVLEQSAPLGNAMNPLTEFFGLDTDSLAADFLESQPGLPEAPMDGDEILVEGQQLTALGLFGNHINDFKDWFVDYSADMGFPISVEDYQYLQGGEAILVYDAEGVGALFTIHQDSALSDPSFSFFANVDVTGGTVSNNTTVGVSVGVSGTGPGAQGSFTSSDGISISFTFR